MNTTSPNALSYMPLYQHKHFLENQNKPQQNLSILSGERSWVESFYLKFWSNVETEKYVISSLKTVKSISFRIEICKHGILELGFEAIRLL